MFSFLEYSDNLTNSKKPNWIGEGAEYCKNPKLIMEKAKIQLTEIIERVSIIHASEPNRISIYPTNQSFWKFNEDKVHGSCHTFFIPDSYKWKHVRKLDFAMKSNVHWKINSPGNFEVLDAKFHYNITDSPRQKFNVFYEVYHMLDYTEHHPCVNDKEYEKDTCSGNLVFKESMETVNCTWPFLTNKNHICTEVDSAIKAMRIGINERRRSKCPNSCNYIKIITIPFRQHKTGNFLIFFLPYSIKVHKAYYAYDEVSLIAEIGGYVGLCLGFSVYQFTDLLNWLMNAWKRYQT